MMNHRSGILVGAAIGAALFAASAMAQRGETGAWYSGATSGFWGLSPDSQVFEGALGKFGVGPLGGRVEEPAIEKQYTGYRFNELFSVEGAQSHLSLPAAACSNDALAGDLATACHGASWSVSGVATLPFQEGLSLYGRLGLQYWQRNGHNDWNTLRAGMQDMGAAYGLGISYEFRKDWYIHAESERFSDLSQGNSVRLNQELGFYNAIHSIGLSIRF